MNRDLALIEIFVIALIAAALAWHFFAPVEAQEITKRDLFLNDVRAANLAEPHDDIECMQIRAKGETRLCITELQWFRQHMDDAVERHWDVSR